jgi:hypothetical protein
MFFLYFTNVIQIEAMLLIYTEIAKSIHALHYSSIQLKCMFVVQNHVHFINEGQRFIAPYALRLISTNLVVHHDSATSNSFFLTTMNSYDPFFEEKRNSCWPIKYSQKQHL